MIALGISYFQKKFIVSGLPHPNFYLFIDGKFKYTVYFFKKINVSSSVVVSSLETFWDKEKTPSICKWKE
jgi:hypothetical protein